MDAIKTFGISTCVVLIISSLTSMIVPNISQKNIMRIIISAFILSGMLYSFFEFMDDKNSTLNSAFSLEAIDNSYEEIKYSKEILNSLEECAVNALYPIIDDKLKKYNIEQFGINVLLNLEKNGVSIKCVNITIYEPHINSIDNVLDELRDELGLDVNINVMNLEGN